MRAQHLLADLSPETEGNDASSPLRALIVFHDCVAGQRAMRLMEELADKFGDDLELQPYLWSFGLLDDVDWYEAAAREAAQADVLIIATSSPGPLPPAVSHWVEETISRKRGTATAVVALFGSEGNPDEAGSPRLEAVRKAAQQAGLEFFAPVPAHEYNATIAHIHERAEMMSPVLEHILFRHERPAA